MGGGGGMMKTVHRTLRAGSGGRGSSQEPCFSHSSTRNGVPNSPTYKPSLSLDDSNSLSFSSDDHPPHFSSVNHPDWANSMLSPTGDESDDDFVLCTVPSMDEVNHAVSSLQEVLYPATSCHEYDWIEPSTSMLQSRRDFENVYDAFHLLQTEPSVKRMVVSLSSDKSFWDAVMNNEMVRELRDSVYEANDKSISGRSGTDESSDDPNPFSDVLSWIFMNMKAKVMDVVETVTETVNKLFQSPRDEKKAKGEGTAIEPYEKKPITSSFMISIIVLLTVIVSRASTSRF